MCFPECYRSEVESFYCFAILAGVRPPSFECCLPPRLGMSPGHSCLVAVVIVLPFSKLGPRMSQRGEQHSIQAFVAQLAVEPKAGEALPFDKGILGWLARSGGVPFHAPLLRPAQDCHAGQLGAVVADDHVRLTTLADDRCQLSRHPGTPDRRVRDQPHALPVKVIDDAQDTEAPPAHEAFRAEVQRPTLVRPPAGLSSARAGPAPVCGHHGGAHASIPRGRYAAASCGSA